MGNFVLYALALAIVVVFVEGVIIPLDGSVDTTSKQTQPDTIDIYRLGKNLRCVDGVVYVKFDRGFAPVFDRDSQVKPCNMPTDMTHSHDGP